MKPSELLLDLQQIDTESDVNDTRIANIRHDLNDRAEITAIESELAVANHTLSGIESDQKDLELQVEQLRTKLQTEEGKLYGGKVSNSKELTDLTHEVDQTKRQIAQRDERLMEIMEHAEAARSTRDELSGALTQTVAARQLSDRELKTEGRALVARQAELKEQREAQRALVTPQQLAQYDRLRVTKGGVAAVRIIQRICQGCRVTLPTTEEHRARMSETLVMCSSCGRIVHSVS